MRKCVYVTGFLPDTKNCGLRMRQECRERFPRHRLQRKPLVSDPGMHHGTCFTHVPWCKSGSLTRGGGKKVPGIPGACATRNFPHLVRGPWRHHSTNGFDTELPRVYDWVYSKDENLTQCSDVIKSAWSGSHFIAQTSKFLLMDATAVTLGQCHGKSSSTFPLTHIFFVPNMKGLAQTVLTWEGNVFAAADADAAETDWKHKVTPDRGDLMINHNVLRCRIGAK